MKPEDLQSWANAVILMDDRRLRGSKHQNQIKRIQDLVKELKESPTPEIVYKLLHLRFIKCLEETEYVAHCRYLQHCVATLRNNVHLNEGKLDDG